MSDKTPTPLERLEAWVAVDPDYRKAILEFDVDGWDATLRQSDTGSEFVGVDDTPDEAILAALAQA
jgi:hypothetical protein